MRNMLLSNCLSQPNILLYVFQEASANKAKAYCFCNRSYCIELAKLKKRNCASRRIVCLASIVCHISKCVINLARKIIYVMAFEKWYTTQSLKKIYHSYWLINTHNTFYVNSDSALFFALLVLLARSSNLILLLFPDNFPIVFLKTLLRWCLWSHSFLVCWHFYHSLTFQFRWFNGTKGKKKKLKRDWIRMLKELSA